MSARSWQWDPFQRRYYRWSESRHRYVFREAYNDDALYGGHGTARWSEVPRTQAAPLPPSTAHPSQPTTGVVYPNPFQPRVPYHRDRPESFPRDDFAWNEDPVYPRASQEFGPRFAPPPEHAAYDPFGRQPSRYAHDELPYRRPRMSEEEQFNDPFSADSAQEKPAHTFMPRARGPMEPMEAQSDLPQATISPSYQPGTLLLSHNDQTFVIVKRSRDQIEALRIIQYRDRPSSHVGIVYSGHYPPAPFPDELRNRKSPVPPAIRVECDSGHFLPEGARLDLTRLFLLYPEHIQDRIGSIHENSRLDFTEDFVNRFADSQLTTVDMRVRNLEPEKLGQSHTAPSEAQRNAKDKLSVALQNAEQAVSLDNGRDNPRALPFYRQAVAVLEQIDATALEQDQRSQLQALLTRYKERIFADRVNISFDNTVYTQSSRDSLPSRILISAPESSPSLETSIDDEFDFPLPRSRGFSAGSHGSQKASKTTESTRGIEKTAERPNTGVNADSDKQDVNQLTFSDGSMTEPGSHWSRNRSDELLKNPKLLETVEDTVRRIVVPELESVRKERAIRETRSRSLGESRSRSRGSPRGPIKRNPLTDARWTKIDKSVVSPEALRESNEAFEERPDHVLVMRYVSLDEIQQLADRTVELVRLQSQKLKATEDLERTRSARQKRENEERLIARVDYEKRQYEEKYRAERIRKEEEEKKKKRAAAEAEEKEYAERLLRQKKVEERKAREWEKKRIDSEIKRSTGYSPDPQWFRPDSLRAVISAADLRSYGSDSAVDEKPATKPKITKPSPAPKNPHSANSQKALGIGGGGLVGDLIFPVLGTREGSLLGGLPSGAKNSKQPAQKQKMPEQKQAAAILPAPRQPTQIQHVQRSPGPIQRVARSPLNDEVVASQPAPTVAPHFTEDLGEWYGDDPGTYYRELDDLEAEVAKETQIESIFPRPSGRPASIRSEPGIYKDSTKVEQPTTGATTGHCQNVLGGILKGLQLMQRQSFCGDHFTVLVEDSSRTNVVNAVEIAIADVRVVHHWLSSKKPSDTATLLASKIRQLLLLFGVRVSSTSAKSDSTAGKTGWVRPSASQREECTKIEKQIKQLEESLKPEISRQAKARGITSDKTAGEVQKQIDDLRKSLLTIPYDKQIQTIAQISLLEQEQQSVNSFDDWDKSIKTQQRRITELRAALEKKRSVLSTIEQAGAIDRGTVYREVDLAFLCSLLALAVVSYAGSHCMDFGHAIWSEDVDEILFNGQESQSDRTFALHRRRLACLDGFIGGPVWVFGTPRTSPAHLSISLAQLSGLWGPLFAIPHEGKFDKLVGLQTEGGMIFRIPVPALSQLKLNKDETLVHWIDCSPPRKRRQDTRLLDRLIMSSRKQDKIPKRLDPFPANTRLLIGHPPPAGASLTVTTPPPASFKIQQTQFRTHDKCSFDLDQFQKSNSRLFHHAGTYDAYWVPEGMAANFGAGQYVTTAVQRTWKRKPARTFKNTLLMELSNPRIKPDKVRRKLQYHVGLEYSACTANARRVTLEQALCIAHWAYEAHVRDACERGDAGYLLDDINELSLTGHDEQHHFNLFWPYGDDVYNMLELPNTVHRWLDLLKESRSSACFAVASGRCIGFQGPDDLARMHIRKQCSQHSNSSRDARPLLQTMLDLDPNIRWSTPLEVGSCFEIANGKVEIRNSDCNSQLLRYIKNDALENWLQSLSRRGPANRELVVRQAPVQYRVPVCITD